MTLCPQSLNTAAPLRATSEAGRVFPKSNSWSHLIGGMLVQWAAAICAGLAAVKILRLHFLQALLARFTSNLLFSPPWPRWKEAANMKLAVAILAVFASIAVTIDATVYFKEQFLDGGTVTLSKFMCSFLSYVWIVVLWDWLLLSVSNFIFRLFKKMLIWKFLAALIQTIRIG